MQRGDAGPDRDRYGVDGRPAPNSVPLRAEWPDPGWSDTEWAEAEWTGPRPGPQPGGPHPQQWDERGEWAGPYEDPGGQGSGGYPAAPPDGYPGPHDGYPGPGEGGPTGPRRRPRRPRVGAPPGLASGP